MTGRRGIVRPVGKAVEDEEGCFHPLGMTFFWGLHAQKHERERLMRNLRFLAPYRLDYLRILAEVRWPDQEIDPAWTDYEEQLGALIDTIYERAGARVQITLIGGGTGHDPLDVAAKVTRVIKAGRAHKVIALEMANEYDVGNKIDISTMVTMLRYLRAHTPTALLALSSPGDAGAVLDASTTAGATLLTIHTDRSGGEGKWLQVRQGWVFKEYPMVVASNEPPGPNSSVDTNHSPLQLAMMRATAIVGGGAMYVLHVGDMVAGRENPARQRHANLWQVQDIDAILKAVRGVDELLPHGIENWLKLEQGSDDMPLMADAFTSAGSDHGVSSVYAAADGKQFVMVVNGVLRRVTFIATRACRVTAFDPLTRRSASTANLAPGEKWTLPGRDDTMAAYIVHGRLR